MKLYERLARTMGAIENCKTNPIPESIVKEWLVKYHDSLAALVKEYMPSGSGFDNGTRLGETSTSEKLVFTTSFHHMNEGMYDGWTEHTVTVKASLAFGFDITVSGRNRNGIKEHIADCFYEALITEVES